MKLYGFPFITSIRHVGIDTYIVAKPFSLNADLETHLYEHFMLDFFS
jgi:hypothetical protein